MREPSDGSGRGLHIVNAVDHRWGTDVIDDQKVVWFELAVPSFPERSELTQLRRHIDRPCDHP